MANFNTHLTGAFVISGTLGLIVYKAGLVTGSEFLWCVLAGTLGGLLPDIDSDNSTPIKVGFNVLSLAVAFLLVMHWRSSLPLVGMFALWIAGYALMRYGVFYVFTRLTVHRGIIHSVPYMLVLALLLVCVNYYVLSSSALISWMYGVFLFLGALVHLSLDEMYSVDLLNRRLKRSSGTAMKWYRQEQRLGYGILYAGVCALLFISPPIAPFWQRVRDPITWMLLYQALLPSGWS